MIHDLFVIGGGINGTAIARDAAGRGLSVFLAEQGDLASGTSSASTKLIHGGLRYLEHKEFALVRKALVEREVLLTSAPHIIWPMRFLLPHHDGLRPRWLVRLGLFLYDHLGGRKILPPTRSVDLRSSPLGLPLKEEFTRGYEYSDCWVDDARLVVLNARDAADRGSTIRTHCKVIAARRQSASWDIDIESNGAVETVQAKILVNAAGPWVSQVLQDVVKIANPDRIRCVKGSHVVVEKLFDHATSYIFQNADGRICFAIPYEHKFTLIGTTDEDHQGPPGPVAISDEETDYLLKSASEYFHKPVTKAQVRWSYAGIRPLFDDGASKAQEATRDYVLRLDNPAGSAPLLSVFGGKITTARLLAENVMDLLKPHIPALKPAWTAKAHLPGGDMAFSDVATTIARLQRKYSFLKPANVERMFRAYGSHVETILGEAQFASDLGPGIGPLSAREIDYLKTREWAKSAEDILWRRSKLGLHLKPAEQQQLRDLFEAPTPPIKPAPRRKGKPA